MKSVWKTLSSAGKAFMTGAQSGIWLSVYFGECLLMECGVSAAFLTLLSASRCVAGCLYPSVGA